MECFFSSNASFGGLFGYVEEDGSVKNVGVVDSYILCGENCGCVVGQNHGSVSGVFYTGVVKGANFVGGIIGNNKGSLNTAYNSGTVYATTVGGIVGGGDEGRVQNVYNTGAVNGNQSVGGVVGECLGGNLSNAYYNSDVYGGSGVGFGSGSAEGISTENLANLNIYEAFPLLTDEAESPWAVGYSFDKVSGKVLYGDLPYLKDFPNGQHKESISFTVKEEVIQISTAEDLKNFAKLVNDYGVTDANAELTTSITLNSNLLGENNANVKANGDFDVDAYQNAHHDSLPESCPRLEHRIIHILERSTVKATL